MEKQSFMEVLKGNKKELLIKGLIVAVGAIGVGIGLNVATPTTSEDEDYTYDPLDPEDDVTEVTDSPEED